MMYIESYLGTDRKMWESFSRYLDVYNRGKNGLRDSFLIDEILVLSKKNPAIFKILFFVLEAKGMRCCMALLALKHLYGRDPDRLTQVRDRLFILPEKKAALFFLDGIVQQHSSTFEDFSLVVEFLEGAKTFNETQFSEFKRRKVHGVFR